MDVTTLISNSLGKQIKPLLNTLSKEFSEEIKQIVNTNILDYQIEEYNRNSSSKTLLHRSQPKKLKEYYQPLFISKGSTSKRVPTESIKTLFKEADCITLIGNAGSGKSTLVKYLFINSFDENYKTPITVELRYLNDYEDSLINYIKNKIFKLSKLASHDRIIERLMKSGNFIFFLDGYDELISSKKEKITKEIDNLVKLYKENSYLLTSRPFTEVDLLPRFHNYNICKLSELEINSFIKKQIPITETELREKMIEAVSKPDNIAYKSFLGNPLLLSMFILTFQSYSSIPQKRSEFYSQVFEALFSVHDSMSKLAFVREKKSGLSKEQIMDVLKLFSFISFFEEQYTFTMSYFDEKLSLIKNNKDDIDFNNSKIIDDLTIAIGIVSREGSDFTFPHRSLQEYFSALYISTLEESNKIEIYKKIEKSLSNIDDFDFYEIESRDNFYLLLSELDEISVIQHLLIPYLEKFTNNFKRFDSKWNEIHSKFINIQTVYSYFYNIIKCDDIEKMKAEFDKKVSLLNGDNTSTKAIIDVLDQVVHSDIKPFLINYLESIEIKKTELKKYVKIKSENNANIISLIK